MNRIQEIVDRLSEAAANTDVQAGIMQLLVLGGLILLTYLAARGLVYGLRWAVQRLAPSVDESNLSLVRRVAFVVAFVMLAVLGFGLLGIDLSHVNDVFAVLNEKIVLGPNVSITLMTPVLLVVVWIVTDQSSKAVQRGIAQAATVRGVNIDDGSVAVFQRLIHYLVLTIGAVVGLQVLGIDLGTLVAAGAVFAVGVGLALQNLAQNFVSGIMLLLERAIKPGDVVVVDGQVVQVRQLGIRSTIARTRDGEAVIIPNSSLVQNTVTNMTHEDHRIRVRVPVGVAYGSDMAAVPRVLREAASRIPWQAPGSEPVLLWTGFGNSSVDWEISVWADDPWRLPQWRTELAREVWDALKEAGITIAFPQVDVHFDAPVEEALRLVREKNAG